MKKYALITGIAGQDGAYLSQFLLEKEYNVVGLTRKNDSDNLGRLKVLGIDRDVEIVIGDITNQSCIDDLFDNMNFQEVYNLAGISSVFESWQDPVYTQEVNGLAATRLVEAMRKKQPAARLFQASSANIYGGGILGVECLTEKNQLFNPVEPYGVAKLTAYLHVRNARDQHGIFALNGILFNHESPLREDRFVFKKIVKAVVAISQKKQDKLALGNIDVKLDWGFAEDYVRAMWMTLQYNKAQDYMICTGEQNTLRDLLKIAFKYVGISDWEPYTYIDPSLLRKKDIDQPRASSERLRKELGWKPECSFEELVKKLIDYEKNTS